jgi:protocatechuate 3,4-dioxygenase beta subunit
MTKNFITAAILLCSISPQMANCQNTGDIINNINLQLKQGKTTISKVLSSDSLMYLHSLTPFREIIKANARPEKIKIVADKEPGMKITVTGSVVNKSGEPQKNVLIYFYQTSNKGWYSDTGVHILMNSGDINHARLFGYLKTNEQGEFSFETIRPNGYPKSDFAGHIHIHFWSEDMRTLHGAGELQFDDDPRMTPERRRRSLSDGYLISKNTGTEQKPVYEFKIIVD